MSIFSKLRPRTISTIADVFMTDVLTILLRGFRPRKDLLRPNSNILRSAQ